MAAPSQKQEDGGSNLKRRPEASLQGERSAPARRFPKGLPAKPKAPEIPLPKPGDAMSPPTAQSSLCPLLRKSPEYWLSFEPAPFQRPEQICSFSYDEQRRLWHDDRSLKYFHIPPSGADLNKGFGNHVNKDESRNEHLDSLLASLMELAKSARISEPDRPRQRADVITWRGQITKLCTALYEEQHPGFEMNVMLVNGTLYLEEHLTVAARQDRNQRNLSEDPRDLVGRKLTYHGSSFESWCTHDTAKTFDYQREDPWNGDVNTNVQWCSVVKTKLGPHRMILGGEVDCIDERSHRVELKISMTLSSARDVERFERKLLKFYIQSFLLGTERILIGFRDQNRGLLETSHEFETLDIPKAIRGRPHAWDQQACLNMTSTVLSFIREQIIEHESFCTSEGRDSAGADHAPPSGNDEETRLTPSGKPAVYRVSLVKPFETVKLTRLTDTQVREEVQELDDPVDRVGFIPVTYYQFAQSTERIFT